MKQIYPKPRYYEEGTEEFIFSDKVYFTIDKNFSNNGFKAQCVELWKNFTAGKAELVLIEKSTMGRYAVISKDKSFSERKLETEYEYEIDCDKNSIHINYGEDVGLIHAFFTVLQLIGAYRRKTKDFVINTFRVKDKPALKMRGIHLCILKGVSLLFLKKCIALCAFLKVSHIALESFGFLEFDSMRELGWPEAYKKSDVKEIVEFGKALGIEFIPFFNHGGHATQSRHKTGKHVVLNQAPEYEELFMPGGWTWNVDNEEVIELQRNVRKELCDLFGDGEFFHIGCDEMVDEHGIWEGTGISESEGFSRFLNRTSDDIKNNLGRKTMMWGDMFLDNKAFPYPFARNTNTREELTYNLDKLTKDMYIVDWQYDLPEDKDETIKYFLEYIDASKLIQATFLGRDKILARINLAKKYNLYGVLGTTWHRAMFEINDMRYTACCMWEAEPDPNELLYSYACHAKTMAMQFIRKLIPTDNYKDAGFTEDELLSVLTI